MNSARDCTVAVDERSWSAVKQLYRDYNLGGNSRLGRKSRLADRIDA